MKRILILTLALLATTAFGVYKGLVVSGGPLVEVPVTFTADDVTPSVATGNNFVTGVNTGATAITDLDNPTTGTTYKIICGSVAGGFQSTIADGGNFTLNAAWNPAAVGDSIMLYCRADNDYVELSRTFVAAGGGPITGTIFYAANGAVGAPSYTFLNDAGNDTGFYLIGADTIGVTVGGVLVCTIDATGTTVVGGNGPWGTVIPDYAFFTDVTMTGDTTLGQGPEDLLTGLSGRGTYITYSYTFDDGNDANLAADWNIAGVVGAGTNEETTVDGWNTLITGGGGGPDSESTVSNGLNHYRAYGPRIEQVVTLPSVAAGFTYEFGFYAAANDFVEIIFEPATSANWLLRNNDTAGAETVDSGVAATTDPTKLEIWIETAGDIHWAIDDVAMTEVGITNQMTAAAHYVRWYIVDVAAAAHTARVDYFMSEQLRQQ